MSEERFEDVLKRLRDSYNPPPPTPREEMWEAIRADLNEGRDGPVISIESGRGRWGRGRGAVARWVSWSVAAAALLVLGIGIGRWSGPESTAVADGGGVGTTNAPSAPRSGARNEAAFRYAAVEHLLKSEPLLTMVRHDAGADRYDANLSSWAGELLTETRLLLDSPAADDPAIGGLLEDLELILVQLSNLSDGETQGRSREELDLIARGMDQQEMLLRIQAVVPGGATRVGA